MTFTMTFIMAFVMTLVMSPCRKKCNNFRTAVDFESEILYNKLYGNYSAPVKLVFIGAFELEIVGTGVLDGPR